MDPQENNRNESLRKQKKWILKKTKEIKPNAHQHFFALHKVTYAETEMSFNETAIFQDNLSLVTDERISMTYRRNKNDTAKPKNSEGNQLQCHLVRYKSRKDWPEVVPGAPRWEAGENPAHPCKACNLFSTRAWQKTRCVWNVMAHAQKPDFVFRPKGRVHLNRPGGISSVDYWQPEVCALAVVMLDTPCSEVVWRVLATHSIHQFPLHFSSRASPCAITFQLESTGLSIYITDGVSIPEVLGSNLDGETAILIQFLWFSSVTLGKYRGSTLVMLRPIQSSLWFKPAPAEFSS